MTVQEGDKSQAVTPTSTEVSDINSLVAVDMYMFYSYTCK